MKEFLSVTEANGITYQKCEKLEAKHGFFTRLGGVSKAAHLASLNVGYGLGDEKENVDENRRRIASALGFEIVRSVSAKQIHSAIVHTVTEEDLGATDIECDGFVTDIHGVALMIKTADCVPILFFEGQNKVIGAVHAGWRGTSSEIAAECVKKMCELGASKKLIKAAIGPCIRPCCYEVDQPFFDAVNEKMGEMLCSEYVKKDPVGDRFHADLQGLNRAVLISSGILEENIFVSEDCTCCLSDRYFSHRASKGKRGVMMSAVTL